MSVSSSNRCQESDSAYFHQNALCVSQRTNLLNAHTVLLELILNSLLPFCLISVPFAAFADTLTPPTVKCEAIIFLRERERERTAVISWAAARGIAAHTVLISRQVLRPKFNIGRRWKRDGRHQFHFREEWRKSSFCASPSSDLCSSILPGLLSESQVCLYPSVVCSIQVSCPEHVGNEE